MRGRVEFGIKGRVGPSQIIRGGSDLLNDFKMIVHKLSTDLPFINIYPIADLHLGSAECDLKTFELWLQAVESDPLGYVTISGDMMNMGLKTSKTNVYEEVLGPHQQKEMLFRYLRPIKDRIIGAVSGNHEYRGNRETGMNPLYDVFCRLQIEDVYRENTCFIKMNLGKRPNNNKLISYGIVLHHGSSKNKREKWFNSIDGADVFIVGHTHEAEIKPPGKIVMDMRNECINVVEYTTIVCNSFQDYGGYALRGMFPPQQSRRFQKLILNGTRKHVGIEVK